MHAWAVRGVCFLLLMYLVPSQLSAQYLDPGSSSILIQVLMGGLVGLAAVLKLYWGKISGVLHRAKRPSGDGR